VEPTIIIAIISLVGVITQAFWTYFAKAKEAKIDLSKVISAAVAEQFQRLEDEIEGLRIRIRALEQANASLEGDKRGLQDERSRMISHMRRNNLPWPPTTNGSAPVAALADPRLRPSFEE